jgi:prolyl oligopeptidase
MRAGVLIVAFAGCAVALAEALAMGAPNMNDPYTWLEDVHGAKALDWVQSENRKSLALLKGDPRYQAHFDTILSILDAQDRIPLGALDHG